MWAVSQYAQWSFPWCHFCQFTAGFVFIGLRSHVAQTLLADYYSVIAGLSAHNHVRSALVLLHLLPVHTLSSLPHILVTPWHQPVKISLVVDFALHQLEVCAPLGWYFRPIPTRPHTLNIYPHPVCALPSSSLPSAMPVSFHSHSSVPILCHWPFLYWTIKVNICQYSVILSLINLLQFDCIAKKTVHQQSNCSDVT